MAEYKLKAIRSFQGDEGTVRRGDIFSVDNEERADVLKKLELAENAPSGAEITNFQQKNEELKGLKVDELKKIAEEEGVTVPNYITLQAQQTARALRGTESGTTGGTATGSTGGATGSTGGTGAAAGGSTGGAAGGSTGGA